MNYNYLPVKAKVIERTMLDGKELIPGSTVEMNWVSMKRLEREGKVERLIEMPEAKPPIRSVMAFTPVYRLESETVKALMELEWEGGLTLLIQRDNPTQDSKRNILHQYQEGRAKFLASGYDAMLVVESDIVPPKDAIKRLAALNVDCAYGVYQLRNTELVNIFEKYPEFEGADTYYMGESLSYKPWLILRAAKVGRFPCSGGGLGIILIRRKVLEEIEFRRVEGGPDCDTYFTLDVCTKGFSQAVDFGVVCGHKGEDGVVRWPGPPSYLPQMKCDLGEEKTKEKGEPA